jgi:hypothetical protein
MIFIEKLTNSGRANYMELDGIRWNTISCSAFRRSRVRPPAPGAFVPGTDAAKGAGSAAGRSSSTFAASVMEGTCNYQIRRRCATREMGTFPARILISVRWVLLINS